jgi:hypothetical protein
MERRQYNTRISSSLAIMSSMIFTQVVPHLQSMFNYLANKHINTGDRILDTAIIGVCTIIFTTCINYASSLVKRFMILYHELIKWWRNETSDDFDPAKVDPNVYNEEALNKYRYVHNTLGECTAISKWLINKYPIAASCPLKIKKDGLLKLVDTLYIKDQGSPRDINMPVYRYMENNKYEYIIFDDCKLYCNHAAQLKEFMKIISPDSNLADKNIFSLDAKHEVQLTCKLNTAKTFDRVHCESNNAIIALLDKFKTNTLYPPELSLDNKLGFILHGPPGTGKTGTCSAIANYLGRDILLVNGLVTGDRSAIIKAIKECQKTHVIVLDEFDYILNKPKEDEGIIEMEINYTEMLIQAKTPEEKEEIRAEIQASKSKVSDEQFLLQLLDSFGDDSDRIIVATTNHIDKINPKYLRPGRFDAICLLSFCNLDIFSKLTVSVYKNIDELTKVHETRIASILERNITPLILINTLVKTSTFEELLDVLEKRPVQTYVYPEY